MKIRETFVAALLLAVAGSMPVCAQDIAPLTTCRDVAALTREEVAEGRPVRVRGVVTFVTPGERPAFFLQDETVSTYVSLEHPDPEGGTLEESRIAHPGLGMAVEVTGITAPGGYGPIILAQHIENLGTAGLPPAKPTQIADFWHRNITGRISVTGVVQRARWAGRPGVLDLELADRGGLLQVIVYDAASLKDESLVDAKLRLKGIYGMTFNSRGEWVAPRLLVPRAEDVVVLTPGGSDPFDAPSAPLYALQPFRFASPGLHRVKLSGVVTLCRPGEFLFVQGPHRGYRVSTRQQEAFAVGDEVEASGFTRMSGGFGELSEAIVRKTGRGRPPKPTAATRSEILHAKPMDPAEVWREDYHGTLVQMRGRLLKSERNEGNETKLYLDSDNVLFTASYVGATDSELFEALRLGSELEVTGICTVELGLDELSIGLPEPRDFSLLLRDAGDVQVVASAPWWTPARLGLALLTVGGTLVAFVIWSVALRRRVAAQTAVIRANVQRESVLEERQRIARELHDTVQQELTGIGMLVGGAVMQVEEKPTEARQSLELAGRMVQRCKSESRASIENLHSVTLENGGLPEAIEEQTRPLAELGGVKFVMEIRGTSRRLPARVETALLRIAHEAAANAGRHAAATTVSLVLEYKPDEVTLQVKDDGCGFDATAPTDTAHRPLGLLSQEQRALKLNGVFQLDSTPGAGTTISVTLPTSSL